VTARLDVGDLARFCRDCLLRAGANRSTADAATRAVMHGSRLGIDSHGVRLLAHYVKALQGGRVAKAPRLRFARGRAAAKLLDAGHAHGALAAYAAMDRAMLAAARHGVGAVAIANTSHFGPAGAYAVAAAKNGFVGLSFCNSDAFVRLHGGALRFHGTNPIAVAAPVAGERPWLLDMATSAVPYNRVQLYRSLGRKLPAQTASDSAGRDTREPARADMLAPLGAAFGFKGAALAGLVEILTAGLAGMPFDFDILPMGGPDFRAPRRLAAFMMAIDPAAFLPKGAFEKRMAGYVAALRGSRAARGARVLAPGDREWAEEARRVAGGVPIDPATEAAFARLARTFDVPPPRQATPNRDEPSPQKRRDESRGR
jgi:LDH2 family malate/lactate/ureidoglycolate dehydrogenase